MVMNIQTYKASLDSLSHQLPLHCSAPLYTASPRRSTLYSLSQGTSLSFFLNLLLTRHPSAFFWTHPCQCHLWILTGTSIVNSGSLILENIHHCFFPKTSDSFGSRDPIFFFATFSQAISSQSLLLIFPHLSNFLVRDLAQSSALGPFISFICTPFCDDFSTTYDLSLCW